MDRGRCLFLPIVLALGCQDPPEELGPPNDAGPGADGGVVLEDAGAWDANGTRDSGAEDAVTLNVLANYCVVASDGFDNVVRSAQRAEVAACGEPIGAEELSHVSWIDDEPQSCTGGAFAQAISGLEAAVQAGRLRYDPQAQSACLAAGRRSDGGTPFDGGELTGPCARILTPQVGLGGGCERHDECLSGYCRAGGVASCGGRCEAPLAVGAACAPRRDVCGAGSSCEPAAEGRHRCLPQGGPGSSCGPGFGACVGGTECVEGRCAPPLGRGEVCARELSRCAADLVCASVAGDLARCWPAPGLGEACQPDLQCAGTCLRCDLAQGRCVVRGGEGDACVPGEDHCLLAYDCSAAGRCELRPRPGEACAETADFPRGNCLYRDHYCRAGTCVPLPRLGEVCGSGEGQSFSCAEGMCQFTSGANVGVCAPPEPGPGPGEACANQSCREGAFCAEGTCQAVLSSGASCTEDRQCQTGWCDTEDEVCKLPCSGCGANPTIDFYATLIFFGLVQYRRRHRAG